MRVRKTTLTIIVPVYNEEETIGKILHKLQATKLKTVKKQIIVINDGSTDGTAYALKKVQNREIEIYTQKMNRGKGAAIRKGLKYAKGEIIVVQDADLEYDPNNLDALLEPILNGSADVVYGSRFVGHQAHRVLFFWHSVGNKFLTMLSNMLTNLNLTDMETGYKMFTREVLEKLELKENRFGFEPEFTARVAKMNVRVYEVGISYFGRSYSEGKKINWQDGANALWCILKYNLLEG